MVQLRIDMKKKRVIVISSGAMRWGSCVNIAENLIACFELIPSVELIKIQFLKDRPFNEAYKIAVKIKEYKPDILIFPEIEPHPLRILSALSSLIPHKKMPKLIFHIYGDFTIRAIEWLATQQLIIGLNVSFLCASRAQKSLIGSFFLCQKAIDVFYFPYNSKKFYFSSELRKRTREALQIKPKEKILIYVGRVSKQKNVDILISTFQKIKQKIKPTKLFIVGQFDDFGAPTLGLNQVNGEQFSDILPMIDRKISDINFFSLKKAANLNSLFNAADSFASFSLTHDEDFAMAVSEALATGLPVCLSSWGGHTEYISNYKCAHGVPVYLSSKGLLFDQIEIQNGIVNITSQKFHQRERTEIAKKHAQKYSIDETYTLLEKKIVRQSVFKGFNSNLVQIALKLKSGGTIFNWQKEPIEFYKNMYSNFLKEHSDD